MTEQLPTVTYKHLVAGSVFHYQKRKANKDADNEPVKTITFSGKKGEIGYYSTSDADEIAQLDALANNPQVQLERVAGDIDVALKTPAAIVSKVQQEEVAQVVTEVQESAVHGTDPNVISAQDRLGKLLAATKGQA